jgi:polyisoprenoid-binding protein YceI
MASVSSGDTARDEHLRSPDFLDVESPHGHDVDHAGFAHDPFGHDRAVFSARGRIDREDWGLTWNMLLESGGLLVSKAIELELEVETVRRPL